MFKPILLSLFLICSGCATADWAQIADSTTTGIALHEGYVEGNPLLHGASWPLIVGIKLGVTQGVKALPTTYCEPGLMALTITGVGASVWNIGVLLGSGPASFPVIGISTWYFWNSWWVDAQEDCHEAKLFISEWSDHWNG